MANTASTFDKFIPTVKDETGAGMSLWINPDQIVYLTPGAHPAYAIAHTSNGEQYRIMTDQALRLVNGE